MKEFQNAKTFLFSVDLEDVRLGVKNGMSYKERVPINTYVYLNWLNNNKSKCTFFTTGNVGKLYPTLIKEIASEGHEIACHTTNHVPLDKQTPLELKKDLETNIAILMRAGVSRIEGFRAPIYSLTEKTEWSYMVLKELGFLYSSSVLPAKNPLYGWEKFGNSHQVMKNSVIEIPLTVGKFGPFAVPFAGGVYFRIIPKILIGTMIKKNEKNNLPLVGFFHPYDIDNEQERFMHSGINNNKFYNLLMYYNRKNVLKRLNHIMERGYEISTYSNFVKKILVSCQL